MHVFLYNLLHSLGRIATIADIKQLLKLRHSALEITFFKRAKQKSNCVPIDRVIKFKTVLVLVRLAWKS
jgi:hypothetical protein